MSAKRPVFSADEHARKYPAETAEQHRRRYAAMAKKNSAPAKRTPKKLTETDLKYLAWQQEREAEAANRKHKKKPE